MRLLIVSPYFPPQLGAASVRVWSLAQEAINAGIQTDVLTTKKLDDQVGEWPSTTEASIHEIQSRIPKFLAQFRKTGSGTTHTKTTTISRAVSTLRARTGIYSSVRMPDFTDFWVRPAMEWARQTSTTQGPWDVVLSSSGPYTAHLVAMQIKRSHLAQSWIADFRDLWTANHAFAGLFPFTVHERRLEREVLTHADAITTVSEPLAQWIRKRSRSPVQVILNGFGERATNLTDQPWDSERPIELVYTGQLYSQFQNAIPLLGAIARLRSGGIKIKLKVAGASAASWEQQAKAAGINIGDDEGLELIGEVSHDQAIQLQRCAHALIGFEWKNPNAGVLTNKLFEYIAAGPLILLTGPSGPMHELLKRTGRGIHLGNQVDEIERTLRQIVDGKHPLPLTVESEVELLSREHQSSKLIALCQGRSTMSHPVS